MTRFPIYINYDPTKPPVGFIELDEAHIPKEIIPDIAVVPSLVRPLGQSEWKIVDFGLIPRTQVDTRERGDL